MPLNNTIESNLLGILPPGRYQVTRLLGAGAFGHVFVGRDVASSAPVVLKLLQLTNSEVRARTERELALLKNLDASPHVVSLIDGFVSPDARLAVLISDYVEGPTIQSLVERHGRGLPNTVVSAISRQLCVGLEYLHGQGIVHRDIKPSNVVITNRGVVKLLDFGLAVLVGEQKESDSDITKVGTFVGTMRYAAPEMLIGKRYGTASDVYSLGITALFMLLGRQPFEGAALPFLVDRVLKGGFAKELPESLQAEWGDILSKTLHVNPESRPSAGVLRSMLEKAFVSESEGDSRIVSGFLQSVGDFHEPPSNQPTLPSPAPEVDDDDSLKGKIQYLAAEIHEVQAALADATATFKNRQLASLGGFSDAAAIGSPDMRIEATFTTVRRRLELNWRASLIMTFVLFSVFVAMLVLAVVFGLIYQKSYWGILFGGTSALSLLTVVVWKPMDKMLFSTIATQQLELIQLNYQRASSGSREERREAFRDVSTQLNALLAKVTVKSGP